MTSFEMPISEQIWDMKYRFKDNLTGKPIDITVEDTWRRIAEALAEKEEDAGYVSDFYEALEDWKYIPAGRIVAGAGTGRAVTLFNCFVMGTIPDSMDGIFSMLREAALTMQQGGGIGYDFSPIRPKGALVKKLGADASGPLTFMDCWDSMCRTVMSAGSRRGAMMATMRCDHPDIMDFIDAKADPNRLRMFNMSVLVTDEFMKAVKKDGTIRLRHIEPPRMIDGEHPRKLKDGTYEYGTIKARELWEKIMRNTYAHAEPGVIFIDRINEANNLRYVEQIAATNPCGEQPLPPYGACLLGSINLARLIENEFTDKAGIDRNVLAAHVATAVRMMDNVVDVSNFPLEAQRKEAQNKRRIGLGVTGLADALVMCGLKYGSPAAVKRTDEWMRLIDEAAYRASVELAKEKGPFPLFDADEFLADGTHASRLPLDLTDDIREHGIRNALLTSIAPTGTISLYAGNVSSGIEPIFAYGYTRKVLQPDGSKTEERVEDYAVAKYREWWKKKCEDEGIEHREITYEELPDYFVSAQTLSPEAHVVMQAAAQRHVDSSISKTINVPEDISFENFQEVYMQAYESGCKGCTTYRPNDVTGSVLSVEEKPKVVEVEAEEEEYPTTHQNLGITAAMPDNILEALQDASEGLLERPDELDGTTYKIEIGGQKSIYLTINDMVLSDGTVRPFEIFLRSSDPTHDEWMQAMSRMISAILRRPHDASFIPRQLKRIHSPVTGGFVKGWQGRTPSLVAAIGTKLEQHMKMSAQMRVEFEIEEEIETQIDPELTEWPDFPEHPLESMTLTTCLSCGSTNMKKESGCESCLDCGESKCG